MNSKCHKGSILVTALASSFGVLIFPFIATYLFKRIISSNFYHNRGEPLTLTVASKAKPRRHYRVKRGKVTAQKSTFEYGVEPTSPHLSNTHEERHSMSHSNNSPDIRFMHYLQQLVFDVDIARQGELIIAQNEEGGVAHVNEGEEEREATITYGDSDDLEHTGRYLDTPTLLDADLDFDDDFDFDAELDALGVEMDDDYMLVHDMLDEMHDEDGSEERFSDLMGMLEGLSSGYIRSPGRAFVDDEDDLNEDDEGYIFE
ncbi:hypothetical protein CEUSTIGMA_g6618.t1 [Chlamydomonas eustigma]|uniref:Uncharacterized protein n=1 Tax=Chlamydomonas eustigma TaxID=1157962 RepID=A0A250X7W8_9CHLO|nr:hypothetical protein CEUSTIGMA_g6618.t1 [Chlamydomonas eustigma]|eukprot:GAX79178.1 hypothetical protein CEUSTIGMA_g6618.t1 [Chlamydomonas eustigma]